MELLGIGGFVGGWILLGILSSRFGHDSRDQFYDPPTRNLAGSAQQFPEAMSGSRRKARRGFAAWRGTPVRRDRAGMAPSAPA